MVVLDVSELISNPLRTGIQRVVRELIRRWPADVPMQVARYNPVRGLVAVPEVAVDLITDRVPRVAELPPEQLAHQVASVLNRRTAALPSAPRVFVPEVFFDQRRCDFHYARLREQADSVGFIVYDFIPWLHPDRIGVTSSAPLMPYLRLLSTARRLAFISAATRAVSASRPNARRWRGSRTAAHGRCSPSWSRPKAARTPIAPNSARPLPTAGKPVPRC
jgi:hypothetical protein